MLADYSGVIIGIAIAVAACVVLYFVVRRAKSPGKSENFLPEQPLRRQQSTQTPQRTPCKPPSLPQQSSANTQLIELRQNLRLKVMYDEAKVERLINFERKYNPRGSEADLLQAAIDRWERDNR